MKKTKIYYTKEGKVSSVVEEDDWLVKSIVKVIILGLILFLITLWITNSINPNPVINKICYKSSDEINFILYNPSKAPAEDFNMIIFERYGGGAKSYADNELCSADTYNFQPKYTILHCDYIPPKTKVNIGIIFGNESQVEFKYSAWGKTTPKEDFEEGYYTIYCDVN